MLFRSLTESNQNNDWEMMGKDVKKLQELIDSLEKVKEKEDKKKEELQKNNNDGITNSTDNTNSIEQNDTANIITSE